ncbi:MAG: hypothetical protein MZV65_48540 [Chromatiales bacterium]|nr:hypothetical protein [Chromatiales bacterium]
MRSSYPMRAVHDHSDRGTSTRHERRAVEAAIGSTATATLTELEDAEVELKLVPTWQGRASLTPGPALLATNASVQFVVCKTRRRSATAPTSSTPRTEQYRIGEQRLRRHRGLRAQPASTADGPRNHPQGSVPEEPGQGSERHGRGIPRPDHHLRLAMTLDKARQLLGDPGRLRRLLQLQRREADPGRGRPRARPGARWTG